MNIETPTLVKTTQPTETQSSTASSSQVSTKDDGKTFKGELASAKAQETTPAVEKGAAASTPTATTAAPVAADSQNPTQALDANLIPVAQTTQEALVKANAQQQAKDKLALAADKNNAKVIDETSADALFQPIQELNAKIETINKLKNGSQGSSTSTSDKSEKSHSTDNDKSLNYQSMKMSTDDAMFFVNLVKNEQFSVSQNQIDANNSFVEIKSEATQAPIQVSATLMNSLADAAKTNKPFRIDFDNNVAVIMKVDKQGKLSAEFIPGDAAVENYLKNNIPALQQSFSDKGLAYNDLSYRKQKQQQQQNNNNQQYKENDDE